MKAKSLNTLKSELSAWAKENRIEIFHGDDSSTLPSILYSNEGNAIESFKNLILKVSPPFLIIATDGVEIESRTYQSNLNLFKEKDPNFVRNHSLLSENKNELLAIEIGFVYQGVFFAWIEYADWYEEFKEIKELIKITIFENADAENEEGVLPEIPDDEMSSLAREIAFSEEYTKAVNRSQRDNIAKRKAEKYLTERGLGNNSTWEISYKADEIFLNEVKPKLEKERSAELKTKVLDLKAKGLKKVQVASKIGITLNILNKYWESETV